MCLQMRLQLRLVDRVSGDQCDMLSRGFLTEAINLAEIQSGMAAPQVGPLCLILYNARLTILTE